MLEKIFQHQAPVLAHVKPAWGGVDTLQNPSPNLSVAKGALKKTFHPQNAVAAAPLCKPSPKESIFHLSKMHLPFQAQQPAQW